MTILHSILLIIVGALVLLGLCWVLLRAGRAGNQNDEYDERQRLERGNAYRIAFWIGIAYYVVVITLGAMDGTAEILHFLVMVGIQIQILAFHFCCLLTQSLFSLVKNTRTSIGVDFLLGTLSLYNAFRGGVTLDTKVSELGTSGWIELLCGMAFIYMGLMQVIQLLCREKE